MSKKITKKKVSKKVTTSNFLDEKAKKKIQTTPDPVSETTYVRVEKTKGVNHLFERSESLSQDLYKISDIGRQVEISISEVEFINKAFEDFKKAQEILNQLAN